MSASGPSPLERLIVAVTLTGIAGVVLIATLQHLDRESVKTIVEVALPETYLASALATDPAAPEWIRRTGVTTLVREPYTLDDMLRYGLAQAWHPKPDALEIRFGDDRLSGQAAIYLTSQLGLSSLQIRLRQNQYIFDVQFPAPLATVDPRRFILEIPNNPVPSGFRKALHLPAGDWGPAEDLDQFTEALAALRPDAVIPDWQGGTGAGFFFRAYLGTPWLRKPGIVLPDTPLPEAAAWALGRARRNVIRSYSLSETRMLQIPAEVLQGQLVRRVQEQGVRFLYLALPKSWPPARAQAWLLGLARELEAAGFKLGAAGQERWPRTSSLIQGLLTLGLGAGLFLFIWRAALRAAQWTEQTEKTQNAESMRIVHLKPSTFRWITLITVLALTVLQNEGPERWGIKATAWLIAVLFPLVGLVHLADSPAPRTRWGALLADSFKDFFILTLWSLPGGLMIAALLGQPAFRQRLDSFPGFSVVRGLVVWLGVLYLFPNVLSPGWWQSQWSPGNRMKTLALLIGLPVLLTLLFFYPGTEGSLPERFAFRLPDWLGLSLGSTLLFAGLAGRRWPARTGKIWPDVFVACGLAGQVSLLSAFTRAYTPLALSLVRVFNGLSLGLLLGTLLVVSVRAMQRKRLHLG